LAVSTEKDQIQLDATIINPPENVNAYHTEVQRFAEAIAKGKPSPVPAEQTLQVIKVLDGIYRSHKLGKEVKL
jgi:predicted dehydrogenase